MRNLICLLVLLCWAGCDHDNLPIISDLGSKPTVPFSLLHLKTMQGQVRDRSSNQSYQINGQYFAYNSINTFEGEVCKITINQVNEAGTCLENSSKESFQLVLDPNWDQAYIKGKWGRIKELTGSVYLKNSSMHLKFHDTFQGDFTGDMAVVEVKKNEEG